jgi:hypothetical protein
MKLVIWMPMDCAVLNLLLARKLVGGMKLTPL